MMLRQLRPTTPWLALLTSLTLALPACSSSEGPALPVNVIDLTDGGLGGGGCVQPNFPLEQPDLSIFAVPRFLLTTLRAQQSSTGQSIVDPGDPIEAQITVNSETRKVMVELADAWGPQRVIDSLEVDTTGNRTIDLFMFSELADRGRYYMKLTLCGADCDARQVVFDLIECPLQQVTNERCGINAPYQRTVFEDREVVQVDNTCIDLGAVPGVGSGTILIQ